MSPSVLRLCSTVWFPAFLTLSSTLSWLFPEQRKVSCKYTLHIAPILRNIAWSAGILLGWVSVTTLWPPCETAMLDGGGRGRRKWFSSSHPLPYPLLTYHSPPWQNFFLSPVFHCMKISRWRLKYTERSLEKISPNWQTSRTIALTKK